MPNDFQRTTRTPSVMQFLNYKFLLKLTAPRFWRNWRQMLQLAFHDVDFLELLNNDGLRQAPEYRVFAEL